MLKTLQLMLPAFSFLLVNWSNLSEKKTLIAENWHIISGEDAPFTLIRLIYTADFDKKTIKFVSVSNRQTAKI